MPKCIGCGTYCSKFARALSIDFELPTDHPCSTMSRNHCMHQFVYDLTQKQCCHCEIVIPILDYVELQEEGLV